MLTLPGWGVSQTVGSEATGPLIAIVRSRLETVEIAFGFLDFPNQSDLCLSKRRNMELLRLLANLLHFHGITLLLF
jgi:hypothetical protein